MMNVLIVLGDPSRAACIYCIKNNNDLFSLFSPVQKISVVNN